MSGIIAVEQRGEPMEWIVEAESLSDFVDHGRYTISTKTLIRCRECKHMQKDEIFHQCWCNGNMVKLDDYCSYAERRQDD